MAVHAVQFSGGGGSWLAAKRVAERYGTDDLVLLCADTRSEHEDWGRSWRPLTPMSAASW